MFASQQSPNTPEINGKDLSLLNVSGVMPEVLRSLSLLLEASIDPGAA